MEKDKDRKLCPYSRALNIFGDRWSLLVVRDLMFMGKNTYGDFLKSPEGIATNILAARLTRLEENDIIRRSEHPESKAKVLYTLTKKGIDLLPMMVEWFMWTEKYYPIPAEIRSRMAPFIADKQAAIRELTEKLNNI